MNINKDIAYLIIKIMIITTFIIVSIPLRAELEQTKTDTQNIAFTASNSSNLSIDVIDQQVLNLMPLSDIDALKEKPILVKIDGKGEYNLYFKYSTKSEIKPEWIKVAVNGDVNNLTDLIKVKDEGYEYYLIDKGTVNNHKTDGVNIWLDSKVGNEAQSKNLIYSFELK